MDVIKNRYIYFSISVLIIIIGFGVMTYNKIQGKGFFNYDIQFTGGTSIEVNVGKDFESKDIDNILKETLGVENAQIQKIGDGTSVSIKVRSLTQDERVKIKDSLLKKYELTESSLSIRDISATISSEMRRTSLLAIVVSCIAMLIYVSLRFKNAKIGTSAIMGLVHDALVLLAFYGMLRIPLNDAFIAAILTVLGYSINATIVIFDRIRENNRGRRGSYTDQSNINLAINQSLRRSIFTSLTTFFTVISLYIFGVESVKIFALPISIGIVCGTYSSIFIVGSILYTLGNFRKI